MLKPVPMGLLTVTALALAALGPAGSASAANCPNQEFRVGPSSALPDCRAYERVTPLMGEGRKPEFDLGTSQAANLSATELASPDGNSYVFLATAEPLAEPAGANGVLDVYETVRTSEGWKTVRRLTPTGTEAEIPGPGGVSPDHQFGFDLVGKDEDKGSLALAGGGNFLQRPNGLFEPIGVGSLGVEKSAEGQWLTSEGRHIVFSTGGARCGGQSGVEGGACVALQLEPTAPPTGTSAVYDRSATGPTRVVSLLPGNVTPAAKEGAEYQGTSADGSVVAFKIGGVLYARVNNMETVMVAAAGATFAGISQHGENVFYLRNGNIFDFSVGSELTQQANTSEDAEVTHISEDGSHVYFVSRSLLSGSEGTLGQPNMYVWNADTEATTFVATLVPGDIEGGKSNLTNWTTRVVAPTAASQLGFGPGADASRTSADGTVIAFESSAKLTQYENKGFREIYLFREGDPEPVCVSCNPTGAPATSGARFEYLSAEQSALPQSTSVVVNNVSADGKHVFFETSESLLPSDHDGINDIYEWSAGSAGGEPSLVLISSGQTPARLGGSSGKPLVNNLIASITSSDSDVFFFTTDPLLSSSGVGGEPAVYDARVDGGFAEAAIRACSGDACQPPSTAPVFQEPGSVAYAGRGNAPRAKATCEAKKKKKKGANVCSRHRNKKKQTHKHKRKASHGAKKGNAK